VLGLYIRSVGKVYALIGGVAATTLAYILPAASYLATRSIRGQLHDESKQTLLQQHDNNRSYHSIGECSSSSTSSDNDNKPIIAIEEEPVVIDLDDGSPCWYLDLAAGLLIVWGFVVMFYSTKGVFAQP
jgi:sodium-coupled neutral amino acid transporter 11